MLGILFTAEVTVFSLHMSTVRQLAGHLSAVGDVSAGTPSDSGSTFALTQVSNINSTDPSTDPEMEGIYTQLGRFNIG